MLGRFLFRWRGAIGFLAYVAVLWLARPTFASCLLSVPLLLAGLAVRFWASGYIGIEGRAREIGASRRIASGPYRLLRHPLYIGNSLLVCGMLVAMRPPLWLAVVALVGFVAEYTVIVVTEEKDLAGRRCQMSDVRCEMSEVRDAESGCEGGRSQKSEARMQNAEFQKAVSGKRGAEGESFSRRRALCEWRTWVVTGVGFGLALVKALIS
jgi:hypothetical protein